MKRFMNSDICPKILVAVSLIIILVFSMIYQTTGFEYLDKVLTVFHENNSTVYSGRINGEKARFTVSEDKSVMFTCGDKSYGPFTVVRDHTAVPDVAEAEDLIGIELREGDELLFRGGVLECPNGMSFFYYEDDPHSRVSIVGESTEYEYEHYLLYVGRDKDGKPSDSVKPSAATILALVNGPELTTKGDSFIWLMYTLICVINAIFILFADDLDKLRLKLRFLSAKPANADKTERYACHALMIIGVLITYIICLK